MEKILKCELCEHNLPDVTRRGRLNQYLCNECNSYQVGIELDDEERQEAELERRLAHD